jgi:hypothetical protein
VALPDGAKEDIMGVRIISTGAGRIGRGRVSLHVVALAAACSWAAGCLGEPGHEPVDGAIRDARPRDAGPRDAAPDAPDASPGPRFVQIAHIGPPGARREDYFGASVALDGDLLAVGMPGEDSAAQGIDGDEDDERAWSAGAVYVLRRTGTGWEREAYLKASNARVAEDNPVSYFHAFGSSVALSGDTLAVSAPGESGRATGVNGDQDDQDAPGSGAVYVFRRGDTGWHQEAYVKPSDTHQGQRFGAAGLALDGDTLAVVATVYPWTDIIETDSPRGDGSSYEVRDSVGIQCAAPRKSDTVYVFRRTGTSWQEEARLPLPRGFWYWDYWGQTGTGTLAVSGDMLAISAPGVSPETGFVRVFRRIGTTWQLQGDIEPPEAGASDPREREQFGMGLAIAGDLLAVGAPNDDDGAVHMFRRNGNEWYHEAEIRAATEGAWSQFGRAMVLDGDLLAVESGPFEVSPEGDESVVRVFRYDGTGWRPESVVTGVPSVGIAVYGRMALSGDDLVIGAPSDDVGADNSGAIHAFRRFSPDAVPPDAGPGSPDAAPGDPEPAGAVVRGIAAGVRGPVTLVLRHDYYGAELLEIAQDGPFAFETRLRNSSYTVTFADADAPCVLRNQTGWIAASDVPPVAVQCASLGNLLVADSLVTLAVDASDHTVDVLLSRESATVTATVARPGDSLVIDGVSVPSGTPSAPLALSLGDNVIDIVVENELGWQRTYRLNLRRAAEIAQHAYAKGATAVPQKLFGASLALSGDTLAVGATGEDSESGAVYVFRRSGTAWLQEALLHASNAESLDHFGASVALSGDLLAVGAPQEDSAALGIGGDQGNHGIWDNGAVYVFRREGAAWQQEAYVKSSRLGYSQRFGGLVALSGDTLAAVGATSPPSWPGTPQPPRMAAVHVFRRDQTGWRAEAVVDVGADLGLHDLALADDTLAVGSTDRAYVYRRSGTSWQQEAQLVSTCESGDGFGASVALSGDTLAVGAIYEDSAARGVGGDPSGSGVPDSGAVFVYRRSGTSWQQEAYVKASNTGYQDHFGASVALSGDLLAVGASGEASAAPGAGGDQADNHARFSGAVYLFRRSETGWQQIAYVKAFNTEAYDGFGARVVLAGDVLAVAAPGEDGAATGINGDHADNGYQSSGAAYVFHHLFE